jgi:hypothetical protein
MPTALQQQLSPLTVVHASGRDDDRPHQAERIDEAVAFAAFALLRRVNAAAPPFSVVCTDWLSMIPALGWRWLPVAPRTSPRNRACLSGQVPA